MKEALDRLNALEIWDFRVERAGDGTLRIGTVHYKEGIRT